VQSCNIRADGSDPTFLDVYEIGTILGSGAFGQVRACWPVDQRDDFVSAVKIIDTRLSSPHLSAREEAIILQSVAHPHIVDLIEVYEQDPWIFVVVERIEGGELFAGIADNRNAVTERCITIVGEQLFCALQHLHERHIVHRDMKAENVLLSSRPHKSGEWCAKLIDFGLAVRMESRVFGSCQKPTNSQDIICGTLYYCAPEIWLNNYSPKVDVWALGVLLYLALYGTYPFYDRDPNIVEVKICSEEDEPPWRTTSKACPAYRPSPAAADCLACLLEKDPLERPTAEEASSTEWFRNGRSQQLAPAQIGQGIDQPIPLDLRLKAGRAAARAPVSAAKEQGRTETLMALQAQTLNPEMLATSKSRAESESPVKFKDAQKALSGSAQRIVTSFPRDKSNDEVVDLDVARELWSRMQAVTVTTSSQTRRQVAVAPAPGGVWRQVSVKGV